MKVVIFAGGYGTRLSEETVVKPKPMVEIGGRPILWHIMKIYAYYGLNEFIICCGYRGEMVKEFFLNYQRLESDFTIDMETNDIRIEKFNTEPWKVTLVDTGVETMTGGRLKRVEEYIGNETFCLTYGDGVSNVDIPAVIKFHRARGDDRDLTAVQPPGRFGVFQLDEGQRRVTNFREKPKDDDAWINGGFFVVEPEVMEYIEGDSTVWEQEPLLGFRLRGS